MKKCFLFGLTSALFLSLSASANAASELSDSGVSDAICVGAIYTNGVSTDAFCVDGEGRLTPLRNFTNDVGSDRTRWRSIYTQYVSASSGLVNVSEMFVDLSSGNLRGAVPVAGLTIPTTTLRNSPTTYFDVNLIQTTGAPRNVVCFSSALINPTTTTLAMSATFYGFNGKGEYTSEWIRLSTNTTHISSTTVSVSTDVRQWLGGGNVAWSYISSVTVQISSMTDDMGLSVENPVLYIGHGQKIGLANNVVSSSDVYKITQAGGADATVAVLNPLIFVNTEFDTIVFSPLPNNADEKKVWYRFKQKH